MKLKFHWSARSGVVIAPPEELHITVVDGGGEPVISSSDLRLSLLEPALVAGGREPKASRPKSEVEWQDGPHASTVQRLRRPGMSPYVFHWELKLGPTLIERGEVRVVARAAARLRSAAVGALIVGALVVGGMSTMLQDAQALFTGVVPFFFGTLAAIGDVRRRVGLWLLNGWLSLGVMTLGMLGIGCALSQIYLVGNQTPETLIYSGQKIDPQELRFVWQEDESACTVAKPQGPGSPQEEKQYIDTPESRFVHGPTWMLDRWFASRQRLCVCPESIPSIFQKQWQKAGTCAATGLSEEIRTCEGDGKATVVFSTATKWKELVGVRDIEPGKGLPCWVGSTSRIEYTGPRNFTLVSEATGEVRSVSYSPASSAQIIELAPDAGELSFRSNADKLGVIRLTRGNATATHRCQSLTNEAGVFSIASSRPTDNGQFHSLTLIDHPWWTRQVPICFDGERPSRVEIVLADGWVPEASGDLFLPVNYLPRETSSGGAVAKGSGALTLRTQQGLWLGTIKLAAGALIGEPVEGKFFKLSVYPTDWRLVRANARVRWKQWNASTITVEVPTTTPVGDIAWNIQLTGAPETQFSNVALMAEEGSTGYQLELKDNRMAVRKNPAGPCFFDKAFEFLGRQCSPQQQRRVADPTALERTAKNQGHLCSSYSYCDP